MAGGGKETCRRKEETNGKGEGEGEQSQDKGG